MIGRQRLVGDIVATGIGFVATAAAILLMLKALPVLVPVSPPDPIRLQENLRIVELTAERFATAAAWDRQDDRVCIDGAPASLFCALANATIDVAGNYEHQNPAMQAVRLVIETEYPDRWTVHPIMDFNNYPDTTRADVESVLRAAADDLHRRATEALD